MIALVLSFAPLTLPSHPSRGEGFSLAPRRETGSYVQSLSLSGERDESILVTLLSSLRSLFPIGGEGRVRGRGR